MINKYIDFSRIKDWSINNPNDKKLRFFYEYGADKMSSSSASVYRRCINVIDFFENALGKPFEYFTVEEIELLFKYNYKGQASSNSAIRTTYTVLQMYAKEYLLDFDLSFRIKQARDSSLNKSNGIERIYVKDYDSLYDYILKYYPFIKDQNPFYLIYILLIYLGVEPAQILMIRIGDIDYDNRRILGKDDEVIVNKLPVSILELFRKATYYNRFYNGFSKYSLVKSDYLIKLSTSAKRNEKLVKDYSARVFNKFNEVENLDFLEEPPMHLTHLNVKKSGEFYKIYMYELENDVIGYLSHRKFNAIFSRILGYAKTKPSNFYLEYENWRDTFYKQKL